MDLRKEALSLLLDWEEKKTYINISVAAKAAGLPAQERRFLTALVYGAVERRITLDHLIGAFAERSVGDLAPHTRNLLRLGLYQLLYMEGVPAFAAVNETVRLGKNPGEKGLVNGVLRKAQRQKGSLPFPPKEKNPARYLSVVYSLPAWLVKHFLSFYGEETEALLAAFNENPPLTVAVNLSRLSRDELLEKFLSAGIPAEKTPFSDQGIRVLAPCPPNTLPGFAEGLCWVQDEASQLVSLALDPQPGETVIDLCACPGGKSFGAASRMAGRGSILSFDLHKSKLSLIASGAERLGFSMIQLAEGDATVQNNALLEMADRVICDVPCSGLGVLSKKPDLRFREKEGISSLPPLQAEILENAAKYLRPGGVMIYSTCTLSPEENEEQVAAFLEKHPDFVPVEFSAGALSSKDGMMTLLPHRHKTDGFFLAKMKKCK